MCCWLLMWRVVEARDMVIKPLERHIDMGAEVEVGRMKDKGEKLWEDPESRMNGICLWGDCLQVKRGGQGLLGKIRWR